MDDKSRKFVNHQESADFSKKRNQNKILLSDPVLYSAVGTEIKLPNIGKTYSKDMRKCNTILVELAVDYLWERKMLSNKNESNAHK